MNSLKKHECESTPKTRIQLRERKKSCNFSSVNGAAIWDRLARLKVLLQNWNIESYVINAKVWLQCDIYDLHKVKHKQLIFNKKHHTVLINDNNDNFAIMH